MYIFALFYRIKTNDLNEDKKMENHVDATAAKEGLSFGEAIGRMKIGEKMRRKGWNGRGIFIALQVPDENSKMTHPYIYIDTTGLVSTNDSAPRDCVPWLASQTDMLSEDWEVHECCGS